MARTLEKSNIKTPHYMDGSPSKVVHPYNHQKPIYDFKTKNKSFVDTQKILELLGVQNNAFHLLLLNPALQGVDPYDENLTTEQVLMIVQECKLNMFYYLREVVRIEEDGGGIVMFRMDRGTLAAAYCFYNNVNFYLLKPRQTGKTVGIVVMLSWAFKFSGPNSKFLFGCYKEELSKKNLRTMKNVLSKLPSYLSNAGTTSINESGKPVRKTDNVKTYVEPASQNEAMVAASAGTRDAAETVGRGYTQAYQYFDETEFIKYIDTIVGVSGMSFNTASRNAEKNGSGYCRIFSTTPGDLGDTKACQGAMKLVNSAIPWEEKLYDEPINRLKEMLKIKSDYKLIYIEYTYKQLGLGEDWFVDACSNVGNDVMRIRKEILLQRFSGNSDSPFKPEDIEELTANKRKPIYTKRIGRIYDILFYEKPKKKRLYFFGIDPSEGTGGDNYSITVIDPYTLQIVAEFKSPYMSIHGCCDLVTFMVDNYFPKALLVIERNRNGGAVIEFMKETKLRNMIYSSPEANGDNSRVRDKMDENGFVKEEFIRNKYFGSNTTTSTRKVMMSILLDAVQFAKGIVNSQYVVEDIEKLVVKNDKIQAAVGEHDDSVMSWLIVLYIYYHGEQLERYGFTRGSIPQDVEEDDKFIQLKKLYQNPEIKKNFPTMYSYYISEQAKEDARLKASHKDKETIYSNIKFGSLTDMGTVNNGNKIVEETIIDDKTLTPEETISIHGIPTRNDLSDNEVRKRAIIRSFQSINKPK